MSKLLSSMYERLGIHALRTSPYHPQTDGLVERFNQTLKAMLRKFVDADTSNRDTLLPHLVGLSRSATRQHRLFSQRACFRSSTARTFGRVERSLD